VSFLDLSALVHRHVWADDPAETKQRPGSVSSGADSPPQVLDETAQAEYNALKHGSRVAAGGFTSGY